MAHETVAITLKTVPVDVEIAPVVCWLNSYRSVFTLWSCQGDDDEGMRPYVMFLCLEPEQLREIISVIQRVNPYRPEADRVYGQITVDALQGCLRYRIAFKDTKKLAEWKWDHRHLLKSTDHVAHPIAEDIDKFIESLPKLAPQTNGEAAVAPMNGTSRRKNPRTQK